MISQGNVDDCPQLCLEIEYGPNARPVSFESAELYLLSMYSHLINHFLGKVGHESASRERADIRGFE